MLSHVLFLYYDCAVNVSLHRQREGFPGTQTEKGPVKRRSQPKTGSQAKMRACRFTLL